jgi:hypothetical protein
LAELAREGFLCLRFHFLLPLSVLEWRGVTTAAGSLPDQELHGGAVNRRRWREGGWRRKD